MCRTASSSQKGAALRLRLRAGKPSNVLRLKQRPYAKARKKWHYKVKGAHRETCAKCAHNDGRYTGHGKFKSKRRAQQKQTAKSKNIQSRQTQPQKAHSQRIAVTGSTRVARRAGM